MLAAEWGVGQMLWSILWFTLFFMWIWLFIGIVSDIFRSRDLGGWGKALWTIFVIVAPFLGVFIYLIARGNSMRDRAIEDAKARDAAMQSYIRDAAGSGTSTADELQRLASLRDQGVIDDAEFQALKAKALAGA
ncbi:MAG: SHOCT domain-containing protein [Ilumatobacteraceae bacterium]|nr:SHOCT domain-containing protein [Ilumatobacteraceae bacterium]